MDFDGCRRPRPKCWGLAWPWAGGRTVGWHGPTAERSILGPRELRPRTWPWGNDPPEDGRLESLDLTIHSVTKERTTVHRTRCPAGPHRLLVRRRTPPRSEAQTGGELVGGRRRLVASSCGAPRPGGPGPRGLSSEKKIQKKCFTSVVDVTRRRCKAVDIGGKTIAQSRGF